jgi:hypothetical protein
MAIDAASSWCGEIGYGADSYSSWTVLTNENILSHRHSLVEVQYGHESKKPLCIRETD